MARFLALSSTLLLATSVALAACGGGSSSPTGGSGGSGGTGSTGSATASSGGSGGAGGATSSSSAGGGGTDGGTGGLTPRSKVRFFVSGHSLTDNPLADYVLATAASLGKDANYNEQIGIGSPIRVRTKGNDFNTPGWPGYSTGKNREGQDMNVIEELLSPATLGPGELYDTLVITERHDILSTIPWEDTFGFVRHYHDRLIDGNPQGETFFYQSWLGLDKNDPTAWFEYEKKSLFAWECVATKVNLTLEAEGRPDRVSTLPAEALAGNVAGITGSTSEKLNQIFNDDVHMTKLGAYYVALVTYAALFRGSPQGATAPADVSAAPVADLQRIAWEFVEGYYTQPSPGEHTMEECRNFLAGELCAPFWNLLGQPGQIAACTNTFSNPDSPQNPFRWPDPMLNLWPDP
jgi:hypothetical protein